MPCCVRCTECELRLPRLDQNSTVATVLTAVLGEPNHRCLANKRAFSISKEQHLHTLVLKALFYHYCDL